ncbi:hypothetical protein R8Z50_21995 [Longispora sp. K20-0274]|uniref:hypothetical protein n=1 Tax=Longispora sp. K20-0274 TaxID=3088255 RepID=UPI00399AC248
MSGRLLVVDFDFFFPNPHTAGDTTEASWALFDWGQQENLLFRELIWPHRAALLDAWGVPLPRCEGYGGFWDRFEFTTSTLFVADSNSYAAQPPLHDPDEVFDEVVLFDAHHDAGYHPDRGFDAFREGRFEADCGEWTLEHHRLGSAIRMFYPPWRHRWAQLEPAPAIPVVRATDPGGPMGTFDAVFACRSGCWVPPWCDDQWAELLLDFKQTVPGGRVVTVDPDLRPRWGHDQEHERATQHEVLAATTSTRFRATRPPGAGRGAGIVAADEGAA